MWTSTSIERILQDLVARRSLARSPGYVAVVVATLALGIGATTALFTVVNGVLLRPLPFHDADRLVMVWERSPFRGSGASGARNVCRHRTTSIGARGMIVSRRLRPSRRCRSTSAAREMRASAGAARHEASFFQSWASRRARPRHPARRGRLGRAADSGAVVSFWQQQLRRRSTIVGKKIDSTACRRRWSA